MATEIGLGWFLEVDTTGSGGWEKLPGQIDGTLDLGGGSVIEVNNKDNQGYVSRLRVSRDVLCSVSGDGDEDSAAAIYLMQTVAMGAETHVEFPVRVTNNDGDTWEWTALLESYSFQFPAADKVTYDSSFPIASGAPTYTPAV